MSTNYKTIEPFKPIRFYQFDSDASKAEYFEICDWLTRHRYLEKDDQGMLTDYHTQEPEFDTDDNLKRCEIWHKFVIKHMGTNLDQWAKDQGAKDLFLENIWTQQTSKQAYHGLHNHGSWEIGANWSFVWYIECDPKVHEPTRYCTYPNAEEEYKNDIKEGRFILWPSDLLHTQLPSFVEKRRCILSGNLHLIGLEDNVSSVMNLRDTFNGQ